jgi:hypothetical protein
MVGDPRGPTPRGPHIKAITHTTHNIDCNGYKNQYLADVPLIPGYCTVLGNSISVYQCSVILYGIDINR